MVSENLARRFRPAGFEQPEGSRHSYTKPRPELQEAFYQWTGKLPENFNWEDEYRKALKHLKDFGEIPTEEANSLLVDFKPKTNTQEGAGLFISACYMHSPEEIIIFDVDAPEIDFIGYKTKKNIFNNGKVGNWFAYSSSGLAVNNDYCGDYFASYSSGTAMNNSKYGSWFASDSSGLVINNGEFRHRFAFFSSGTVIAAKEMAVCVVKEKGSVIEPADCERIPNLKEYLTELEEITKSIKDEESAKRFLERYGPNPKERIERDIEEMIKKGGHKI